MEETGVPIPPPESNPNGRTGWAKIVSSTNAAVATGTTKRVHLCTSNPCKARYAPSKYGSMPVPIHMQHVATAVADTPADPVETEPHPPICVPLAA